MTVGIGVPRNLEGHMVCYGELAEVYDRFMDDFDHEAWTDYYLGLIQLSGAGHPERICDCGCGTGSFSVALAARGYNVTGVDTSERMLEVAAGKARAGGHRIMFVRQDMCRLELPRRVDAILCGCDGVNYLTTEKQLKAFFERAKANLRPGGVLAFDVSTAYKLEKVLGNGFFGEEREDAAYLWKSGWNDRARLQEMRITFFVKQSEGLYRRFSELHRQRAWSTEELAKALTEAGFEAPKVYGDRRTAPPEPEELRMHITAVSR